MELTLGEYIVAIVIWVMVIGCGLLLAAHGGNSVSLMYIAATVGFMFAIWKWGW